MSGAPHRWPSRPELESEDPSPSESNDRSRNVRHSGIQSVHSSSSVSTAHHRLFSAANSHMTNTDDSAHSVEIGAGSMDTVLLRVYREQPTNSLMLLCYQKNVTPNFLRSYSVKLVDDGRRERIDNEECLVVQISSAVNSPAFRLMVENIGQEPTVVPSRNNPRANISFSEFFDLCFVLWSYVCRIDHWMPVAEYIRNSHWEYDFRQWPAGRLPQWLFIALVFDYRDIFERASKALIVDFSELDAELRGAYYLPHEIIDRMIDTRREYMRETCKEINRISSSLAYDERGRLLSLPLDICTHLLQTPFDLDLRQELPDDIHQRLSPGKVLEAVRDTIRRAQTGSLAQIPVPHRTESTSQASGRSSVHSDQSKSAQVTLTENSKTTRDSEAAKALGSLFQARRSRKEHPREQRSETRSSFLHLRRQHRPQLPPEPAPLTPQEINNIYDGLLHQLTTFQRTSLSPLYIDDFASLRGRHVLSPSTL